MKKNLVSFLSVTTAFAVCGGAIGASVSGGDLASGVEEGVRPGAAVQGGAVVAGAAEPAQAAPVEDVPAARAARYGAAAAQASPSDEVKDRRLMAFITRRHIEGENKTSLVATFDRLQSLTDSPLSRDDSLLSRLSSLNPSDRDKFVEIATNIIKVTNPGREEAREIIKSLMSVSPTMFDAFSQTVSEYARQFSANGLERYYTAFAGVLASNCFRANDKPELLNKIAGNVYKFALACVNKKVNFNKNSPYACFSSVAMASIPDIDEFVAECSKIEEGLDLTFLQSVGLLSEKPEITSEALKEIWSGIKDSFKASEVYPGSGIRTDSRIVSILCSTINPNLWSELAKTLKSHKDSLRNVPIGEFLDYLRKEVGYSRKIDDKSELHDLVKDFLTKKEIAASPALAPMPEAQP